MTRSRAYDLLVVGEINPDVVVSDADPSPSFGQAERLVETIVMAPGSSPVLTALAAARLGLRTAFCGLVGDDDFGRYMLASLDRGGVDTHACRVVGGAATGASVILDRGPDRAILTSLGVMASLRAEDVPRDLVLDSGHLHVGSWFLQGALQAGLPALFAAARAAGTSTSLDPNWDPAERWSGLRAVLAETDIFLPNDNEARAITGASDAEGAATTLLAGGPAAMTVVIKAGGRGAYAARGATVERVDAPSTAVVDTIGAGDGFDAGFRVRPDGRLDARALPGPGRGLWRALDPARGGVDGQPTMAEALALAETLPPTPGGSAVPEPMS